MNVADLIAIKKSIEDFQVQIDELKQKVAKLELENANTLKKNLTIKAGVGTKVNYNKDGLVMNTLDLEPTDIPTLSITKIDGLLDMINELDQKINNLSNQKNIPYTITAGTGTKINYNSSGQVISSTTLQPSDIPELPIEKIKGLKEYLDLKPTEITVREVEKSKKITENDLPKTIFKRLNNLEEIINSKANQSDVDEIKKNINKKVDPIINISDGEYTKLKINDNKVIEGNILRENDIPELSIDKIKGLQRTLSKLATESSVTELRQLITLLSKTYASQMDMIRNEMQLKVNFSDFTILENSVMHNDELVQEVLNQYPAEELRNQIIEIKDKLKMY